MEVGVDYWPEQQDEDLQDPALEVECDDQPTAEDEAAHELHGDDRWQM
jgi:hypothetical protein